MNWKNRICRLFLILDNDINFNFDIVNPLLFAATIFHDSSVINGLLESNFDDGSLLINTGLHVIFDLQ
jgi:hypothetical protein